MDGSTDGRSSYRLRTAGRTDGILNCIEIHKNVRGLVTNIFFHQLKTMLHSIFLFCPLSHHLNRPSKDVRQGTSRQRTGPAFSYLLERHIGIIRSYSTQHDNPPPWTLLPFFPLLLPPLVSPLAPLPPLPLFPPPSSRPLRVESKREIFLVASRKQCILFLFIPIF